MSDRMSVYDAITENPEYPEFAQGPSEKVQDGSVEMRRDSGTGFTNPNLHKRIDNTTPNEESEGHRREYSLGVYSRHSIRNTETITHYEVNDGSPEAIRSEESEIP